VSRKAGVAWCIGITLVVSYDYWAIANGHETLSGAFWRNLEKPHRRVAVTIPATLLYKHLVAPEFIPQIDPLKVVVDRWHRKANV